MNISAPSRRTRSRSARGIHALCSLAAVAAVVAFWPAAHAEDASDAPDAAAWGHPDGKPGIPESLPGIRFGMSKAEAAEAFPALADAGWFLMDADPGVTVVFAPGLAGDDAPERVRYIHLGLGWGTEEELAEVEAVWGPPLRIEGARDYRLWWFDEDTGIRASITGSDDSPPRVVELDRYTPIGALIEDERLGLADAENSIVGKDRDDVEATFGDALTSTDTRGSVSIPGVETTLGESKVTLLFDGDTVRGWQLSFYNPAFVERMTEALAAKFGKPERSEDSGDEILTFRDDPVVALRKSAAGMVTLAVGEAP